MATAPTEASLLPAVLTAVREAGNTILAHRDRGLCIDTKGDGSPVTSADFASHRCLVDHLKRLTPAWPVFSEETGSIPFNIRGRWRHYWLLDPLDGTRSFVQGSDEFTINVALIHDGRPVLGAIGVPADGRLYHAVAGGPAHRQLPGHPPEMIGCVPPSPIPRVTISRRCPTPQTAAYLERLGPHTTQPLDSSLKSCRIAEGGADVYVRLGPTGEWDTAAAQCLLEAAGGGLMDCAGRPLTYNRRATLMNPHFLAYGAEPDRWLAPLAESGR